MLYSVTLTRDVLVKIDEKLYTKDVIDQVRNYWGLDGYDDFEVLEYVAENIFII